MKTTLHLLTRDGTLYMSFSPALTPEQYSRVVWLVKTVPTRDEMRKLVQSWARVQGEQVSFEECRVEMPASRPVQGMMLN